jgi:hypothetical protein
LRSTEAPALLGQLGELADHPGAQVGVVADDVDPLAQQGFDRGPVCDGYLHLFGGIAGPPAMHHAPQLVAVDPHRPWLGLGPGGLSRPWQAAGDRERRHGCIFPEQLKAPDARE